MTLFEFLGEKKARLAVVESAFQAPIFSTGFTIMCCLCKMRMWRA